MPKETVEGVFSLSAEMKKELEDSGALLDRAEKQLKVLKDMGLDTTVLDEKLSWSKNIRDTMLKNVS